MNQPKPEPNSLRPVWELVIEDMQKVIGSAVRSTARRLL